MAHDVFYTYDFVSTYNLKFTGSRHQSMTSNSESSLPGFPRELPQDARDRIMRGVPVPGRGNGSYGSRNGSTDGSEGSNGGLGVGLLKEIRRI